MLHWKTRLDLFNSTAEEFTDDLNRVDIRTETDSVTWAVKHFNERVDEWVYPAKSYFVAICYATWISYDFKEDFYDLLNDELLLAGNDPYFKTYSQDTETYNAIINQIELPGPLAQTGMVPDVRSYYEEEMLFDQYPLHS